MFIVVRNKYEKQEADRFLMLTQLYIQYYYRLLTEEIKDITSTLPPINMPLVLS